MISTNGVTKEVTSCEVCGNRNLRPVLDLGLHPMCDDLVLVGDVRTCREYPIEVLFCRSCCTAHQRFQVPKRELFPASYHYRSRFTGDVLNGMAELVKSCEQRFGSLRGKKVVDVGCNDGSLLDRFRAKGAVTMGIEPTDAYRDAEGRGHAILAGFLSEDVARTLVSAHGTPAFITFTNVFAHIEDLQQVLESLKIMMGPQTIVVVENHYLGAVLERHQFDTFYHEHPRTYSYTSFVYMARSLGVEVLEVEFPSRYGGNIRVFLGNEPDVSGTRRLSDEALQRKEQEFMGDFGVLRANVERWARNKKQFLRDYVRTYGKLRAKAFPGRAAILVRLLGIDESSISAVYEKAGSLKIGHYVPGTRIEIHADEALFALADQTLPVLNLAWHISREIRQYLAEHGYRGPVIDILAADDFTEPRCVRC